MSERGCAFAGVKGVITGAIKDVIHVVHSPIGCTSYGYGTKRYPTTPNLPNGEKFPIENFNLKYILGTDLSRIRCGFWRNEKIEKFHY